MRRKMTTICIMDVLHVLKLQAKLLSISKLLSKGLKIQFHVHVLWEVRMAMRLQ